MKVFLSFLFMMLLEHVFCFVFSYLLIQPGTSSICSFVTKMETVGEEKHSI